MTIVQALKRLVEAFGGQTNAKTIVPALKDCATALGGESTAKTASQAIADVADAVEAGGGGGGYLNLSTVTITTTYTFPEGIDRPHTPVQARTDWVISGVSSVKTADLMGQNIPDGVNEVKIPYVSGNATELTSIYLTANDSEQTPAEFRINWNASTCSGGVEYSEELSCALVTGDGHIDVVLDWLD